MLKKKIYIHTFPTGLFDHHLISKFNLHEMAILKLNPLFVYTDP